MTVMAKCIFIENKREVEINTDWNWHQLYMLGEGGDKWRSGICPYPRPSRAPTNEDEAGESMEIL
ncbi:unnamed protein product [Penicillium roqueforti FM164]|uniref:Uncharacterized protein n=1 Tax=Penicillium roqueforti (strain FM164) TaxID=1365484 RepID=W6QN65_PENRF|nr:unnamed protein product [Penicillium roqueforti FM164]